MTPHPRSVLRDHDCQRRRHGIDDGDGDGDGVMARETWALRLGMPGRRGAAGVVGSHA